MTMTRKDFKLIADTLKHCKPMYQADGMTDDQYQGHKEKWQMVCESFASDLQYTNTNFNRSRFLIACGFLIADGKNN
jgi:hypothetical protein